MELSNAKSKHPYNRRVACNDCGDDMVAEFGDGFAIELKRDALEDAAALGTVIATDQRDRVEGSASIRVSTDWPTVINIAEIDDIDIEAARLVYQAQLKSKDLDGSAYLEMWCHFPGGQRFFSRGLNSTVSGTAGWQTRRTVFILKAGQKPTKVTLNLVINGKGTVWIDDMRLLRQRLP